jgi:hypothetical protein
VNSNGDGQPSWEPIGGLAAPAGYSAPAKIQTQRLSSNSPIQFDRLSQLAEEIRRDPLRSRQLADRVYQLMAEDLRIERDRRGWGR